MPLSDNLAPQKNNSAATYFPISARSDKSNEFLLALQWQSINWKLSRCNVLSFWGNQREFIRNIPQDLFTI